MQKLCFLFLFLVCISCRDTIERLPVLGTKVLVGRDSVSQTIKSFSFLNQDSILVTNQTFENKVYVADFIFLSCPSICPMMNLNMLNVYKQFEKNRDVMFLSHTIDPEQDNITRLKNYSDNLKISSHKWHFVTGNKDSIYLIAEKNYFATAYQDSSAPGGFVHSGGLLLIDKKRQVRGVYDGTDATETQRLINDLNILLKE